ncbi:MAG: HEAT repeat domain-containing protein [Pirellulaceae bacterium]|nr:HEAT repeat domain-containing protein [Pirellulaceae bacterium]
MMTQEALQLIQALIEHESLDTTGVQYLKQRTAWILQATNDQINQLLESLCEIDLQSSPPVESLLITIFSMIEQRERSRDRESQDPPTADLSIQAIVSLYVRRPANSVTRTHLLQVLAQMATPDALTAFVDLLLAEPPQTEALPARAFSPLFQIRDERIIELFPKILDGIEHVSVAAAILDLGNFVVREGILSEHPACDRSTELIFLLGQMTQRLGYLESHPEQQPSNEELSTVVSESVSLVVSLCDALALIGDREAIGKLNQTLELAHRRIRAEAAAALARFGEDHGTKALLELASEPVARLRVLAYADELDIADQIADEFTSSVAIAQSEIVLWLADPMQFGVPPNECELYQQETMHWPGYEEPRECFLFRFSYQLGDREYGNIGIAGPLTHATTADLLDLSPDDIFALFAGWDAEHEDIYELNPTELNATQSVEIQRLIQRARDADYESIQPLALGVFFGDVILVASAQQANSAGVIIVDEHDVIWRAQALGDRPLGPEEVYNIYKGRKLLKAFNG